MISAQLSATNKVTEKNKMTEEYTCIECEDLYDNTDGDTDERMCNKCLDKVYITRKGWWKVKNISRKDRILKKGETTS